VHVDYEVPLGSLSLYYRRSVADFPQHAGYLKADPERVASWRNKLAVLGPGLKVGISWLGGTHKTRSPVRSIALEHWGAILRVPGIRFISLQYTSGARSEIEALPDLERSKVVHWEDATSDYDETAALVMALDLTISVCTAVVHLSGALGRPVWVMAPYSPEWRYGHAGDTMPWYPSALVFRQPQYGEWDPVILSVGDRLQAHNIPFAAARTHSDHD
jgi:ADP-heptose:LPS heptosyltransferase